eukprot:1616778-Pyramimonas_sp.AAC.1
MPRSCQTSLRPRGTWAPHGAHRKKHVTAPAVEIKLLLTELLIIVREGQRIPPTEQRDNMKRTAAGCTDSPREPTHLNTQL